jgi:hypothetical protein
VPSNIFKIEQGRFGITLTDPAITDACAATASQFTDYTCQITSGALNASPNVSDETVPATWCDPEQTLPLVGATSYELAIAYLQDPNIVAGLSRFLFENDSQIAWVYMGLDGDDPPKAVAKVRLVSGAIGGEGRTTLTAEATFPCDGKPTVCFGDAGGSESVPSLSATGATEVAGAAGTWTPAGATPPANVADLIAGVPNVVVASPAVAWQIGSYMQTATPLAAGQAYWDGTAWVAGTAPLAASASKATAGAGK